MANAEHSDTFILKQHKEEVLNCYRSSTLLGVLRLVYFLLTLSLQTAKHRLSWFCCISLSCGQLWPGLSFFRVKPVWSCLYWRTLLNTRSERLFHAAPRNPVSPSNQTMLGFRWWGSLLSEFNVVVCNMLTLVIDITLVLFTAWIRYSIILIVFIFCSLLKHLFYQCSWIP